MTVNALSLGFSLVVLSLLVPILVYGEGYFAGAPGVRNRFRLLAITAFLASTGAFFSSDWRTFIVFLEVSVLACTGLASLKDGKAASLFLLIQLSGAALVLLGAAGASGLPNPPLMGPLPEPWGLWVVLGLGVKAAFPPFHFWLPEVQGRVHAPVAALLTAVSETLAIYGLLRIASPGQVPVMVATGAAMAITGSFLAFFCRDLKRLLAYSTVGQAGIFVAVAAAGIMSAGIPLLFLVAAHGQYKVLLFLGAGETEKVPGSAFLQGRAQEEASGKFPFLALTAAILSVAAVPGLPSWTGKTLAKTVLPSFAGNWFPVCLFLSAVLSVATAGRILEIFCEPRERQAGEPWVPGLAGGRIPRLCGTWFLVAEIMVLAFIPWLFPAGTDLVVPSPEAGDWAGFSAALALGGIFFFLFRRSWASSIEGPPDLHLLLPQFGLALRNLVEKFRRCHSGDLSLYMAFLAMALAGLLLAL